MNSNRKPEERPCASNNMNACRKLDVRTWGSDAIDSYGTPKNKIRCFDQMELKLPQKT